MQEVRRCPVCGSIDVSFSLIKCGGYDPVEYYRCNACDHGSFAIDTFECIHKEPEQMEWELFVKQNPIHNSTDNNSGILLRLESHKKKINRPHYKELYEREKVERAKLQAQFVCLKMINENLSKKDQTEKINILLECIDAISKYTSDWYIKNEIKRAREKISKIK